MIVANRQQPLPTIKAVFTGGSGKTRHALNYYTLISLVMETLYVYNVWVSFFKTLNALSYRIHMDLGAMVSNWSFINITRPLVFEFSFFFFLRRKISITQTWGSMGNQTGIEQPTKWSSLWKDLGVLAKESEIWFVLMECE